MHKAYLLTGGNMGDREQNLTVARKLISETCGVIANQSSLYETAAWGNTDQPSFLNQVLELNTSLSATQLMHAVLEIETKMGRIRNKKYDPRIIDIDILLFGDEIHTSSFLKVPHPELQNRRFVLVPLAEIAPGIIHPILKKTIHQLLRGCPDKLKVTKYD